MRREPRTETRTEMRTEMMGKALASVLAGAVVLFGVACYSPEEYPLENPYDPESTLDYDKDGVPNNEDAFPMDPVESKDTDSDGVGDNRDNCLGVDNSDQRDADSDGMGDVCDDDRDGDGVLNGQDASPDDPIEWTDTDGISDAVDNCLGLNNSDQHDADSDGMGDACDPCTDADSDGYGTGTSCLGPDCDDARTEVHAQVCGDGYICGTEICDDGDTQASDGCSTSCQVEQGWWRCWGEPSVCDACTDAGHCGMGCVACSGETPDCGGLSTGCVCNATSCSSGSWCNVGVCDACTDDGHCGMGCVACSGETPECGGFSTGCVCNEISCIPPMSCSGDGSCVMAGSCGDASCNVPGPTFSLADTNQRECYDDSFTIPSCPVDASSDFYGQDAQYGWDTSHAATDRFYRTGDSEPVVTDLVTGLVWQGCADGMSGSDCSFGSAAGYTWQQALDRCQAMDWAGYTDWYLPDEYELQSIVDYGRSTGPMVDIDAFPDTPWSGFWSSSSYAYDAGDAWGVYFNDGYVYYGLDKTNTYNVRCARVGS